MKSLRSVVVANCVLLTTLQAQANFGSEEFYGDAPPRTPTTTNSFFGVGTVRDLLCDNPAAPRCITEIKNGIWKTSVPTGATFVQSSIFQYVPPFDKGFDLTQGGAASGFDIRIRSNGQTFFGFLIDIYAPELPANRAKPSVSFQSQSLNTGGAWQVVNVPFSALELRDGATSASQVLASTHGMSFGVLIAGTGKTLEIDYIHSVVAVPEASTIAMLALGILLLGYRFKARQRRQSET